MLGTVLRRGTLVTLALAAPLLWVACSSDDPPPSAFATEPSPALPPDGVGAPDGETNDGGAADGGKDARAAGEGGATCGNTTLCNTSATPPTTPAPTVGAVGYATAFATAVCARVEQCCAGADVATFWTKGYGFQTVPTAATCVEKVEANYKHFAAWPASVTKGHIAFDASRASSCIAAVTHAACGVPLFEAVFDGRCAGNRGNEVFKKLVPVGGACTAVKDNTLIGDCDPAAGFCLADEGGMDGTCMPWAQPGEACTIFGMKRFCAPQLNCEGMSPTHAGTCSAAPISRKIGQKCDSTSGPTEVCETGAYCDFFSSGTCKAAQPDGTSCKTDDECATQHPFTCLAAGGK